MAVSTVGSASTATGASLTNPKAQLNSSDFLNLLITQLKNQDPTQPMSNQDMLQQVSQIGQLQSQQQLTSSMTNLVLQNQIGAAANLIGKAVAGMDDQNSVVSGVVTSIQVQDNAVNLQLDNGKVLPLSRVTGITNLNQTSGTAVVNSTATN